jgi:putative Holliday junction resolvase
MRWLCLDPGQRRTGVAISSPEGGFAVPLLVLEHGPGGPPPNEVASLMRDHGADGLVIGLPLSMDGTVSAQTRDALSLAYRVAQHLHASLEFPEDVAIPELSGDAGTVPDDAQGDVVVALWDERLTSWEAQRVAGLNGARRKKGAKPRALDAHAAAVILQSFLDARAESLRRGGEDTPPPETGGEAD